MVTCARFATDSFAKRFFASWLLLLTALFGAFSSSNAQSILISSNSGSAIAALYTNQSYSYNFGITTLGGGQQLLMTNIGIYMDRGNNTTQPFHVEIYGGLGGTGPLLTNFTVAPTNIAASMSLFNLLFQNSLYLTNGNYSLTLSTSAAFGGSTQYSLRQGTLSLLDSNNSPLPLTYWVQDNNTSGTAGTNFQAAFVLADYQITTNNVNYGNYRVGSTLSTTVTLTNNAIYATNSTNGLVTERLSPTATASNAATVSGLSTNLISVNQTTNFTVGLSTANVGTNSGYVTLNYNSVSNGTASTRPASLGTNPVGVGSQQINVTGVGYRLASNAISTTNVAFGNFRIGVTTNFSTNVAVTNTAANDGYSEGLGVTNSGTTGGASVTNLPGGLITASANSNVTVGLAGLTNAGTNSGTVTLGFNSSGTGTSGFAATNIGSQAINVSAVGYRLASNAVSTTNVSLGNFRIVNGAGTGTVTITNTATADAYSEKLGVSNSATTGSGTVTNIPAGLIAAGATTNVTVGLNTANAGTNSGTVTLGFNSSGVGTSGFAATNIGSQVVNVSGVGYRLATNALNTTNVNLGNFRIVNGAGTGTVTITNAVTADGFSEGLGVSNSATSGATVTNIPGSLVAAGAATNVTVGLSTANAGTNSGTVTLGFNSSGVGTSGFAATNIGSQVVNVSGVGYRLAADAVSSTNVSLGRFHIGYTTNNGSLSGTVGISNTATADGFSEGLAVANNGTSGGAAVSGIPAGLIAAGANTSITVGLGTVSSVGTNSGSVTLGFQSSGTGTSGLAATNIGSQVVNVMAQGYSGQAIWNTDAAGSWNNFDNWDAPGGTPGIDGVLSTNDTASFGNAISTSRTVSLNGQSPVLTTMTFSNASASYTVAQGSGGSITMGTPSASQTTITNAAGAHTVSAAISLARATQVGVATNSKLSVSAVNGSQNLSKSGTGTLAITGTGNLSGSTTVTGGTLNVNGSISNSTVTMSTGTVLSGSGTVGETTIANGATISPGNSPGTLNINGDLNWSSGGNYDWQIYNAAGLSGSGWDFINISGVLDLSALSAQNQFNINMWSLASFGPDVNGDAINFVNTQSYTWTIATAAMGIANFSASYFNLYESPNNGAGGFSNDLGGGLFSLAVDGNNLNILFTPGGGPQPVPEPGTWAAAAMLVGGAAFIRWRKRRTNGLVLRSVERPMLS